MRKIIGMVFVWSLVALTCHAAPATRIEVLQVADISLFQDSYDGILAELEQGGLVAGENLTINRTVIDAGTDPNLWEKLSLLSQIRRQADRIVKLHPDLVITMGTPATKYAKEKFIKAGIPVVFSTVFNPLAVGCETLQKAGPGYTGSSNYMDPITVLKISQLAFPRMHTIGMIHSDEDNALAFIQDITAKAPQLGLTVLSRQVKKTASPREAAEELIAQGVDTFAVPVDTYYAVRDFQAAIELVEVRERHKIPSVAFISGAHKGGIIYVSADFTTVGGLAGKQALKVVQEGCRPEDLPVLFQDDLNIQVDLEAASRIGVELPLEILQLARTVD